MNLQTDFTKLNRNIQEAFKKWDNKILPYLPKQMDEMAKRTGAIQRKRGVCSCVDLLRMLFLYASSNFSFRVLAVAACALGISAISDTAWCKRFSKAVPFLRDILHSLLSSILPAADISAFKSVKNVLLVDASVIRQDGIQQNQQRIHLCYSLNENRRKQVKGSDQHTAESLTHFSMEIRRFPNQLWEAMKMTITRKSATKTLWHWQIFTGYQPIIFSAGQRTGTIQIRNCI